MTRIDYEQKGRADYAARTKDENTYATMTPEGEAYRRGWRLARLADDSRLEGFEHAGQKPIGGTFTISDGERTSRELPHDATPEEVNAALAEVIVPAVVPFLPAPAQPPPDVATPAPEAREQAKDGSSKPPYRVPLMREIAARPKNGFRAVSTFSGCGGSSLGYKMAGFDLLWASEFIPAAQETYRANHPGTILDTRDIREVKPEDILRATGLEKGEIDLFDGSPPCASFSTAGIREEGWGRVKKYSDTKQRTDDLFYEFARLIEGTQPKVFVAENVAGLTVGVAADKMLGEGQLDAFETQEDSILHTLMDCGYRVGFHVLNAADLGVPQSRRRVIFVGIRKDLATRLNLEPVWPRALPWRYTIREALAAPIPPEFDVPGVSIAKYAIGAEWEKLKPGEQSEKYFSLVRTHPDEVCPCICASHGAGGIASIAHFEEKRKFSIGELRRLGGFPDDFLLTGSYEQQWERIGRAVPPVMMAAVAATIRDELLAKIRAGTPAPLPPPVPVIPEPEPLPPPVAATPVPVPVGQLELF